MADEAREEDRFQDDPDAAFSERAAANFVNFSGRTLSAWRATWCEGGARKGPEFFREGAGPVRYRRRKLVEWMEQQERETAAKAATKKARKSATKAAKTPDDEGSEG